VVACDGVRCRRVEKQKYIVSESEMRETMIIEDCRDICSCKRTGRRGPCDWREGATLRFMRAGGPWGTGVHLGTLVFVEPRPRETTLLRRLLDGSTPEMHLRQRLHCWRRHNVVAKT
jgi:hypothetical protein